MRPVQIAELKNRLSAYLQLVRAGEEIVIRDRAVAIAKLVPLGQQETELDEQSLVAAGLMKLPAGPFDPARFWAIGRNVRTPRLTRAAVKEAMNAAREDPKLEGIDVSLLGRQRRRAPVRPVSGK